MTVLDEVVTTVFYTVNKWHGCYMKNSAMFINDAFNIIIKIVCSVKSTV